MSNYKKCPKTGKIGCDCKTVPDVYGTFNDDVQAYWNMLSDIDKMRFDGTLNRNYDATHVTSRDTPGYLVMRYQQPM